MKDDLRIVVIVIALLAILGVPSASAEVVEANKTLVLKNPLPSNLASSTLKIEFVPDNYPSVIHYKNAEICVTTLEQPVCYQRMDIEKFSQLHTRRISSDPNSKYSVINVNENTFIFNFTSVGKILIQIRKIYQKDQQSEYDNLISTIQIPLELTDVAEGGFSIEDLRKAGVSILIQPVLNCPEVKKNFNGFITCDATYFYKDLGIPLQMEPFESFSICAFKGDPNQSYGCKKGKPYFSKDLKLAYNEVRKIRVRIYKDFMTSINMESKRSGEAVKQLQTNVPKITQPAKTGNTKSGRWVRKCKNVTVISEPNGQLEILDGRIQGGSTTSNFRVCEDVWIP